MASPYSVCVFPPDRFEPNRMYVHVLDTNNETSREGWIACPGIAVVPKLVGPDGLFYFATVEGVNGADIVLYRSALVAEDQTPELETLRTIDIGLPTDLPSFSANVPDPSVIWLDGQAALLGYASYTYKSGPSTIQNGTVYSSTPAGVQSISEIEPTAWRAFNWLAAVEFDDGSYSTFSAGVAV